MTDPKSDRPNLDLIRMVQQGRMTHDRDVVPSHISGNYWVESKPLTPTHPPTSRAGEWIIPTTVDAVDSLWHDIKTATEAGHLGYKSKVSTAPTHDQPASNARLIVVRTYDADDLADVARVEQALRALGVTTLRYERIVRA